MKSEEEREKEARRRMEIIAPLLDRRLTDAERVEKKQKQADEYHISERTVRRYYDMYIKGGYKALFPAVQIRLSSRVISNEVLNEAVKLRKEVNCRSVATIIRVLESEEIVEKGEIKRSTLQKNLQDAGWGKKQIADRTLPGDTAVLRFQKSHRMQVLQADIKYGPVLDINGKKVKTYLVAWIDDATRYILGGALFSSQTSFDVHNSFRRVIETYGKPVLVYCDNGVQYVAKILKDTCLRLGIVLRHTRVFSPASKGKIERFNGEVSKFNAECKVKKIKSMEELNAYYKVWEVIMHQECNHTALADGERTPQEAFDMDAVNTPLVFVPKEELDEAFLVRGNRKVHKDGSFSLYGKKYEVDDFNLRGRRVDAYYSPSTGEIMKVKCKGFPDSKAHPFVIGENVDYRLRNKMREESEEKDEDGIPDDSGSRVLDMCRREFEKKNPDTALFDYEKNEKGVEEEVKTYVPSIDFGRLNRKEENNQ